MASEANGYRGCFSATHLDDSVIWDSLTSKFMSIHLCVEYCLGKGASQDQPYIGLSNDTCACIVTLENVYELSGRQCPHKCPANDMQICGGKGAMAVHNLFNTTVEDALVLVGGTDVTEAAAVAGATVYLPDGRTCSSEDNQIPDSPEEVTRASLVATESSLLQCGGYKFADSVCE